MNSVRTILGVLLIGAGFSSARADDVLTEQIAKQKAVQRQSDRVVLGFAGMLGILDYYDADVGQRSRICKDLAETLAKLSREQMSQVVDRLEAARRSQDPGQAEQEIRKARQKHAEIMVSLGRMLSLFEGPGKKSGSEPPKAPPAVARDKQPKPVDPAMVKLLRQEFGFAVYEKLTGKKLIDKDRDEAAALFERLPVPIGGKIPIGYVFQSTVAVEQAKLKFRIVKKGAEKKNGDEFQTLTLLETRGDGQKGDFDLERGVFKKSGPTDVIMFFALPERKAGGGRFYLETKNLGQAEQKKGDRLEFFVELYAAGKPIGRSETRVKQFCTMEELIEQLLAYAMEQANIRDLTDRQTDVFDPDKKDEKKKAK